MRTWKRFLSEMEGSTDRGLGNAGSMPAEELGGTHTTGDVPQKFQRDYATIKKIIGWAFLNDETRKTLYACMKTLGKIDSVNIAPLVDKLRHLADRHGSPADKADDESARRERRKLKTPQVSTPVADLRGGNNEGGGMGEGG